MEMLSCNMRFYLSRILCIPCDSSEVISKVKRKANSCWGKGKKFLDCIFLQCSGAKIRLECTNLRMQMNWFVIRRADFCFWITPFFTHNSISCKLDAYLLNRFRPCRSDFLISGGDSFLSYFRDKNMKCINKKKFLIRTTFPQWRDPISVRKRNKRWNWMNRQYVERW